MKQTLDLDKFGLIAMSELDMNETDGGSLAGLVRFAVSTVIDVVSGAADGIVAGWNAVN